MTSREAFEAHIKSLIESESGEAQALARRPDDDYASAWVRHQWWGFQTGIQHARDVTEKARHESLRELNGSDLDVAHNIGCNDCADAIKEALK